MKKLLVFLVVFALAGAAFGGGPNPYVTRGEYMRLLNVIISTSLASLGIPNFNLVTVDASGNMVVPGNISGADGSFTHISTVGAIEASGTISTDGSVRCNDLDVADGFTASGVSFLDDVGVNGDLGVLGTLGIGEDASASGYIHSNTGLTTSGSLVLDGTVDGVDVAGHVASTGTAVHGLGTMATAATTDYVATGTFTGHTGDFSDPHGATLTQTNLITASATFTGFTGLGTVADGAPKIKMKLATGTTSATAPGTAQVAHGLTGDKIICLQGIVRYATNAGVVPGNEFSTGYNFDLSYDATNVYVSLATGSAGMVNDPFVVLISYTE